MFPSSWFVKLHEHIHRDDLPCCNITKSCSLSSTCEAPNHCVWSSSSCASSYRGVIPVLPYSWFAKLHGHIHCDYLQYEWLLLPGRKLFRVTECDGQRWELHRCVLRRVPPTGNAVKHYGNKTGNGRAGSRARTGQAVEIVGIGDKRPTMTNEKQGDNQTSRHGNGRQACNTGQAC